MDCPSEELEYQDRQHRRYNILKDRWVLVCPHRMQRPWQGQYETIENGTDQQEQDAPPVNHLMPGAVRSSGHRNPNYKGTFVFDNDYPALIPERVFDMQRSRSISSGTPGGLELPTGNFLAARNSFTMLADINQFNMNRENRSKNVDYDSPAAFLMARASRPTRYKSMMIDQDSTASVAISSDEIDDDLGESMWYENEIKPTSLLKVCKASGRCRVISYHTDPKKTIPMMRVSEISAIVNAWVMQQNELGRTHKWVQIFENRGTTMGCSNPHPHCQVWASDYMPNEPKILNRNQLRYYQRFQSPMLIDYLHQEQRTCQRIIAQNVSWVVLVPFWAVWPFETMILPKRHILRINEMTDDERRDLAVIIKCLVTKYDNLFRCSFPYSMGWYGAPTGEYLTHDMSHWQCHCLFYPPLLRSATIKKFMVGYELFAEEMRDLTPEKAAEMLRETSAVHYRL